MAEPYVSRIWRREYRHFFQGVMAVEGRNSQLDEKGQEVGLREGEPTVLISFLTLGEYLAFFVKVSD